MQRPLAWFRSNSGGGTWLAFFALACQLVFTFGHVHFAGVGAISVTIAASADPAANGVPTSTSPARPAPAGQAQDFCAVCNNIALANMLVLPAAPTPLSPVSIASDVQRLPPAAGLASQSHFHFRARGPPSA